jgi:TPR repeat protein
LTRAARQGFDSAQYRLGLILYDGKLVPRDMATAYSWVSLAAAAGNREAKPPLSEIDLFIRREDAEAGRKQAAAFKPVRETAPLK